jgi:hypothetical protein
VTVSLALGRHERLDAGPYDHPLAIWFLPDVVPLSGLADLLPAALRRPPYDCRQEGFDGTASFQRHAKWTDVRLGMARSD